MNHGRLQREKFKGAGINGMSDNGILTVQLRGANDEVSCLQE